MTDNSSDHWKDQLLPSINPRVVFCSVDDGAVLLSTDDEVYFGLNQVGVRVWQMLPPYHTKVHQVCDTLLEEYPDATAEQVRRDVGELLRQLHEYGLVTDPG